MIVGRFNIYEIRFNLDILANREEKLRFLYKQKLELKKVVRSFENRPTIPLKSIATTKYFSDDISEELQNFLKEVVNRYSANPSDRRFISEDLLLSKLKEEIEQYKKFDNLLETEIESVKETNPVRRIGNWILSDKS